jgi:hypothetical protein
MSWPAMNRFLPPFVSIALLLCADAAFAERVYVKARGEVDLAPFRCVTVSRSPNVNRICYDEKQDYVLVSVKGIWYHYCNVPPSTVSAWKKASSKGRYYNDNIRSNFDCSVTSAPSYR